jgi:hypothetical protein
MKNGSPGRRWVGVDFLDQVSRFRIGTCFGGGLELLTCFRAVCYSNRPATVRVYIIHTASNNCVLVSTYSVHKTNFCSPLLILLLMKQLK